MHEQFAVLNSATLRNWNSDLWHVMNTLLWWRNGIARWWNDKFRWWNVNYRWWNDDFRWWNANFRWWNARQRWWNAVPAKFNHWLKSIRLVF